MGPPPRLINAVESTKLNSAVERYCLHSSTKMNEAVDLKMAANKLVPGRCCCDMLLFNGRMSTRFRKKEIRGKTDVLLVLQWGTGRDLLVDMGTVVSHRLLIRVICGESPLVDTGNMW